MYYEIQKKIKSAPFPKFPISKLIEKSANLVDTKDAPQEMVNYIEINDVDLLAGKIARWRMLSKKELPNRATYVLEAGDILIPNHRHCIRGVATVSEEKGTICTNRFFAVRPNLNMVRPLYLISLLRQPEILLLMVREATGEINPSLNWWGLDNIEVPVPDLDKQDAILEGMREKEQAVKELKKQMDLKILDVQKTFRDSLSFSWLIIPSEKLGSEQIADVSISKNGYSH